MQKYLIEFKKPSRLVLSSANDVTSLIVNTPGSSKGCVETIGAVIDVLPHAVTLLVDNYDPHPSGEGQGHGHGHR